MTRVATLSVGRVATSVAVLSPSERETCRRSVDVANLSPSLNDRHPPSIEGCRSVARPDLSDRDAALARWRHSQRRAEAEADWSEWAAAWTWLTTPGR